MAITGAAPVAADKSRQRMPLRSPASGSDQTARAHRQLISQQRSTAVSACFTFRRAAALAHDQWTMASWLRPCNRQSMTPPDELSMNESTPKPIKAVLDATAPAAIAMIPSIAFQPTVR